MTVILQKNPIVNLLNLLPTQIAVIKRKAIEVDLTEVGKYHHYRQSVRKDHWKMADTHVVCAAILMKHLGLSLEFFTGSEEDREKEIASLV